MRKTGVPGSQKLMAAAAEIFVLNSGVHFFWGEGGGSIALLIKKYPQKTLSW